MKRKVKTIHFIPVAVVFLASLLPAQTRVGQWDRFETAVENSGAYGNSFLDVDLSAVFTGPSGQSYAVFGFHDGGTTWRVRHMPDQVGVWTWTASFTDGSGSASGSFDCVPSGIPGMLAKDETNPRWFGFKGGAHGLVRCLHVGDAFFASQSNGGQTWSEQMRSDFLDWAGEQGYNMLSIASHYLNREQGGRGDGWNTPDLWDPVNLQPNPREYDRMEGVMDDMAARGMTIYPFAGFFGSHGDFSLDPALQEFFVKYTTARLGCYWNILYLVTGPERSQGTLPNPSADIPRLAGYIKQYDAYGHPLSVHDNWDIGDAWMDYNTLQGGKSADVAGTFGYLLDRHTDAGDKPVFAQEVFWPGNVYHDQISTSDYDIIRKKGWGMNMAASAIVFADMDGNSSSGFSSSMDMNGAEFHPEIHRIMNMVWDGFATFPFYEMDPRPDLAGGKMCLAKEGDYYLAYLDNGGGVNIDVSPGNYHVTWVNGQDPLNDRRDRGTTSNGDGLNAPADGDDWLVFLVRDGIVPVRGAGVPANHFRLHLTGTVQAVVTFSIPDSMPSGGQSLAADISGLDGRSETIPVMSGNRAEVTRRLNPGIHTVRLRSGDVSISRSLIVLGR